jgi:hypothetical protein
MIQIPKIELPEVCLVDQKPLEAKGYLFGEDVLGHFALELSQCKTHDLGRIKVIGKLASGMKSQWTNVETIDYLRGLEG